MSRYDDDYDDNEDERDDDEAEDEDGVRRSTSNPFSNRPNSVRGAGLPQQQRPPQPTQGGSVPSPIRSGGNNGQGSSFLNRPGTPPSGSGSSGGVQPYQRTPAPTRPLAGSEEKKDDPNDRSAAVNRVLGTFGQKLGEKPEEKKDEKPANPFGSRFGGGDRSDDRDRSGGVGGLTRNLGGNATRIGDDKSSGGLASRFGGGGNDKKDNKPSGGGLGSLTSRFGGGKKDDKPASTTSPYGAGAARLGDQSSSTRQSPLGSTLGGSKPQASSLPGTSRSSPFGGTSTTGRPITRTPAPSLGDRFKGIFGGGKKDQRPAARSRTSKAPRVDQGGLSLDHKLDILGISLLLGSLVLLLSSLSPTKGALTESVNHDLSYAFGWGAVFVLGILFAIGLWLILRHFGDEAPVVSRTRLIGVAMLFLGALVLAQFIDSFQYKVGAGQDYLTTLQMVFLPIAYSLGRGGGWVGGEIYFQLLTNFGEIGGFMVVIGWLIIGLMLGLSLSASDLAMIIVSNARNLSDALRQRRQRAAAERAAQQQTLVSATQQISVTKPAEALPAGTLSPALPAPSAEDQRRIPITTGGRTSSVPFRPNETAEVAAAEADALPVPVAQEKSGLFSRVRGVLPGAKPSGEAVPAPAEKSLPTLEPAQTASGGLRARLLRDRQATAAAAVTPTATPTPTPTPAPQTIPPTAPLAAPPIPPTPLTPAQTPLPQPAAAQQPTAPTPAPANTTPRLGDLLGRTSTPTIPQQPTAPSGVQPFQRPPLTRPDTPSPTNGERKPAEVAAHSDAPRAPIPDLQSRMRALREVVDTPKPAEPARPAPSPAFGKPSDPPFAVPQRSAPAAAAPDVPPPPRRPAREWKLPDPSGLLSSGIDEEPDHEMLLKRAHIIEETLSSFGAPGRVVDVRTGPVVTQFGVEPDYVPGRGGKKNRVKVGAIAALDKDLQLALGAKSIRIEAPVPGKGYVGVEVPNEKAEIVHLRDVLESAEFKKIRSPLAIALGQGVDGTPVAADLGVMPHLLIAGTTGSGKSVCVNAIIASLLLNNSPRIVKFIMVDPKRVELTQYNGVPHLVAPVVVELERIVSVLKWVTREMDERYRKFSNAAARNIEDYNKHQPSTEEPMPYIVVIIDELADLMMLAPDETERVITRIAALARATGIHLVIATQRPSVDVVTGLIKANFPARIAFAVAANTDSRVILDQPGAERLLGRGDMLYMSGDSPAPVRLQGVFVSDTEIGNITRYWRGQMSNEDLIAASRPIGASLSPDDGNRSDSGVILRRDSNGGSTTRTTQAQSAFWDRDDEDEGDSDDDNGVLDGEDEMYDQAVELVRRLNKASVSLLQRRLRIGYTRAARLIDVMEERGIVGPATEGSKPREVLPVR